MDDFVDGQGIIEPGRNEEQQERYEKLSDLSDCSTRQIRWSRTLLTLPKPMTRESRLTRMLLTLKNKWSEIVLI